MYRDSINQLNGSKFDKVVSPHGIQTFGRAPFRHSQYSNDGRSQVSVSAGDAHEVAVIERSNELSEIIAKYKNSLNNRVNSNQPTINKGEKNKPLQGQKSANIIASPN